MEPVGTNPNPATRSLSVRIFSEQKLDSGVLGFEWRSAALSDESWLSYTELIPEIAGRACYQSQHRPNPATAHNDSYLRHILQVGHHSVLRHAVVGVYIQGVSRSLTHELIRHHVGIDFSQLSQRFVDDDLGYVVPPAYRGDELAEAHLRVAWNQNVEDYRQLVAHGERAGLSRKQAREAARAVLPNMTETKIVVTANIQAWRNFIEVRGSIHADAEIRELAIELLRQFKVEYPNLFQDMNVTTENTVEKVQL